MTRTAAIIPAWNEAETIAEVIAVARRANRIDEVLVVDNASTDDTSRVAAKAGARVVVESKKGKGEAMRTGVDSTAADVIVFLDADLLHLQPEQIDSLVEAVVDDGVDMACGLFDRGPRANPVFLHALPILTGQRALRRELFEQLDDSEIQGYMVEAALNALVAEQRLTRHDVIFDGLWHRTKEEKFATPAQGFAHKTAMLATAMWSYVNFSVRRALQPAA